MKSKLFSLSKFTKACANTNNYLSKYCINSSLPTFVANLANLSDT